MFGGRLTAQREGFLMLVGTGVIWGTIGVAAKLTYQRTTLDAVSLTWLRAVIASPVCLLLAWRALGRRLFATTRRDLAVIAALGVVMIVYQYLYLEAINRVGVSVATLVSLCTPPVIVALASAVLFGERLTTRTLLALGGAMAGTGLLVGWQRQVGGSGSARVGLLLALGSACGIATHVLVSRSLANRQHPLRPLAISFPVGAIAFIPAVAGRGLSLDQPLSGWLLVIYLGVGPSAIAYWLLLRGLRDVPATTASIVTLLEPLVAGVLAWLMFGERLGAVGWLGAALLLGAIALLSIGPGATVEVAAEGLELGRGAPS